MGFLRSKLVVQASPWMSFTELGLSRAFVQRIFQILESQECSIGEWPPLSAITFARRAALSAGSLAASISGSPNSSGCPSLRGYPTVPFSSDRRERANL